MTKNTFMVLLIILALLLVHINSLEKRINKLEDKHVLCDVYPVVYLSKGWETHLVINCPGILDSSNRYQTILPLNEVR